MAVKYADAAGVAQAFLPATTEVLVKRAHEEGPIYTHVRPLSDDSRVTFAHDDPALFF